MTDLKPCPFCGGEAEMRETSTHDFFVKCTNVTCGVRTKNHHENPVGAAMTWNTRVEKRQADDGRV